MTNPRIKFTINDYMSTPNEKRYQLLDGELLVAPSPTRKHQTISGQLYLTMTQFVTQSQLGQVWYAPLDVILSNHDVVQPDILFVSNARANILTEANVQGAPDLVVEILSPATAQHDREYKRTLYSRHGVREYWLVDPEENMVEVWTDRDSESGTGLVLAAAYQRGDTLASPLLEGLNIPLEALFS
jgi:Uma2 family endonuclease